MFEPAIPPAPSDTYVSAGAPVIVGGPARSGTTLLSVILNSHPDLVCGPESDLFRLWPECARLSVGPVRWAWHVLRGWTAPFHSWSHDFGLSLWRIRALWQRSASPAEFIDRFFADYARRHGVSRWADKTPANVKCLPFIFAHFPQARFVHLLRDGRDTCCSVLAWSRRYHGDHPLDIHSAAETWVRWVGLGRAWRGHPQYTEVHYEDLVAAPERTLRPLFEFLQLRWDPAVLNYHTRAHANRPDLGQAHLAGVTKPVYDSSIGRWRTDLNPDERRAFNEIAGPTLRELGYVDSSDWVDQASAAPVTV